MLLKRTWIAMAALAMLVGGAAMTVFTDDRTGSGRYFAGIGTGLGLALGAMRHTEAQGNGAST